MFSPALYLITVWSVLGLISTDPMEKAFFMHWQGSEILLHIFITPASCWFHLFPGDIRDGPICSPTAPTSAIRGLIVNVFFELFLPLISASMTLGDGLPH